MGQETVRKKKFLELAQSIQSMKTEINWFTESHPKDSKSSHRGSHYNEKKEGYSVKHMALPTSRFKIRDLKHFKDERTHKPFNEEQETQHIFYYSNLKQAMK